ncbi:hypothetical protein JVU11DRAFT_1218 [Chiua virens]|nr:hypothetical protein JVU11DRAFT_1218 [Chiua virens]
MAKTEKNIKKTGLKNPNPTSVTSSKKILAKAAALAMSKASKPSKLSSEESSSEETSDSDDDDKKIKSVPAKVSVEAKKISNSENDSSESSSAEKSSSEESSDGDSDDDNKKIESVPSKASVEEKNTSDSKHDSSDASSSEDSSESEDEEDEKPSGPVQTVSAEVNKKRKADSETTAPPKKTKLENGKTSAATSEEETRGIFVGRLSWNVDNDWLAQEFAECGEVESAHVQMDRNTGRSRGFGYVNFKTADAVEKALALNGKEIDGRAVNIDKSNPRDKGSAAEKRAQAFGDAPSPPSAVLFVGNLSFGVDEDTLWETFGEHGDVKSVRIPSDRETGKPKGFAYVEFSETEAAKTAHSALQGFEFDGRSIRLDFTQPRDGAGGRGGGQMTVY